MSALNLSFRILKPLTTRRAPTSGIISRQFSKSLVSRNSSHDDAIRKSPAKASGREEGESARTNAGIRFQHPEPSSMPSSESVRGQGGRHIKPTLASFSLEGKVAVVTGGARGLGLVMAQALMNSGAEIALVDMNGKAFKFLGLKKLSDQLVL
jgi:D-arabinitol 2-dehydrogenase